VAKTLEIPAAKVYSFMKVSQNGVSKLAAWLYFIGRVTAPNIRFTNSWNSKVGKWLVGSRPVKFWPRPLRDSYWQLCPIELCQLWFLRCAATGGIVWRLSRSRCNDPRIFTISICSRVVQSSQYLVLTLTTSKWDLAISWRWYSTNAQLADARCSALWNSLEMFLELSKF
jgi:hypothetical protein